MIEASCHCGAVRMTLAHAPEEVTACNCSICRRLGALWAYYRPDEVMIEGEGTATSAYAWGDRLMAFHHCATCGSTTHWRGFDPAHERMAVNARLMEPAVLAAAKVRRFDGADTWTTIEEA